MKLKVNKYFSILHNYEYFHYKYYNEHSLKILFNDFALIKKILIQNCIVVFISKIFYILEVIHIIVFAQLNNL